MGAVNAEKYLNMKKREKERREKDTIFMNVGAGALALVGWVDDELVFMAFIFECAWILSMQRNGRMRKGS